jgi:hypothetical protein
MGKIVFSYKLIGISLAAAFILTSCNFAALPVAPSTNTVTTMASPTPVVPTATVTAGLSVTDTPTPISSATPVSTGTATPTTQLTALVNPGMNAYCRKGPGTYYFSITYLQAGNNYNVIGRDGLDTWWLVQVSANLTCWVGDPTSVTQGPVEQVPLLMPPPLPSSPSSFSNTSHCDPVLNTMTVSLTWVAAKGATGYRVYRNGTMIAQPGSNEISYKDNAPRGVNLKYQIEAINDYGTSSRQTTRASACV